MPVARGVDGGPTRASASQPGLEAAGWTLLLLCAVLWVGSLAANRLVLGSLTWVGAYDFLGVDFYYNYFASSFWLDGGNPYVELHRDPLARWFVYPPFVLTLFAWGELFSPRTALWLWTPILVALAVFGAVAAWKTREDLRLETTPLVVVVALAMGSTPVIAAMERGNIDLLVVPVIVVLALAIGSRHRFNQEMAGVCLAFAVNIKVYPALIVLGLLGFRRWRAIGAFIAGSLAVGAHPTHPDSALPPSIV